MTTFTVGFYIQFLHAHNMSGHVTEMFILAQTAGDCRTYHSTHSKLVMFGLQVNGLLMTWPNMSVCH